MTIEGVLLSPGEGRTIGLPGFQITPKVTALEASGSSVLEFRVWPGFDVGTHRHSAVEEVFYVLEGELDLRVGERRTRGRPGQLMFVPRGATHGFSGAAEGGARVLLTISPPGHERYFDELAALLSADGPPDVAAIAALRARYDTEQLTPLVVPR
jgi:quercetin dioxygenase-like cupin family protein